MTPEGRLYVLDWDDLALGDPMMDWSMLFGPIPGRPVPARVSDLAGLSVSSGERERFELCARASLLDGVIDPLADWVEAAGEEHEVVMRDSSRAAHLKALESYRALFG